MLVLSGKTLINITVSHMDKKLDERLNILDIVTDDIKKGKNKTFRDVNFHI